MPTLTEVAQGKEPWRRKPLWPTNQHGGGKQTPLHEKNPVGKQTCTGTGRGIEVMRDSQPSIPLRHTITPDDGNFFLWEMLSARLLLAHYNHRLTYPHSEEQAMHSS